VKYHPGDKILNRSIQTGLTNGKVLNTFGPFVVVQWSAITASSTHRAQALMPDIPENRKVLEERITQQNERHLREFSRKLEINHTIRFGGERMTVIAKEERNGVLQQVYLRGKTWEGWRAAKELTNKDTV